ncbi:MAG: hypothetical protein ACO23V_07320 [Chitinophagaceae bacterium]
MLKKDDFKFGILIGLIGPIIGLVGFYFWKFSLYSFSEFLHALSINSSLITAITIPCLFVNILFFTYYINNRIDKTAKGIFTITLILAIMSLLFKFFG